MSVVISRDEENQGELIFKTLKDILMEVACFKVIGDITFESSLTNDFGFDSIDIMDMLTRVQETFIFDDEFDLDMMQFFQNNNTEEDLGSFTVGGICKLIQDNLKREN
ncbi:MAG: acyl carrier protein [Desulfobacteraceae bacterium]